MWNKELRETKKSRKKEQGIWNKKEQWMKKKNKWKERKKDYGKNSQRMMEEKRRAKDVRIKKVRKTERGKMEDRWKKVEVSGMMEDYVYQVSLHKYNRSTLINIRHKQQASLLVVPSPPVLSACLGSWGWAFRCSVAQMTGPLNQFN